MVTSRKDRKRKGHITPRLNRDQKIPYKEMIQEAMEPQIMWDNWRDFRDGCRNAARDKSRWYNGGWGYSREYVHELAKKINPKLLKQLRVRRARKMLNEPSLKRNDSIVIYEV
jgi:hypothetical protein